jgi:hypothetical protein
MRTPPVSFTYCHMCDKVAYYSVVDAKLAQQYYRERYGTVSRVYECPTPIVYWHLTHKAPRRKARMSRERRRLLRLKEKRKNQVRQQVECWENEGGSYR